MADLKDAAVPAREEIVVIGGKAFNTCKAQRRWVLEYHDGENYSRGELYVSSKGNWYLWSPSQWSNSHAWMLTSPVDAVEKYGKFLSQDEIVEILALANVETE
jgi:hypothetical protein